jgi:ssDNA-binding Zn-finger/Zn-ribbon topoisomerase 1
VFERVRKRLSQNAFEGEGIRAGQGETCPRCGEHPMRLFHHGPTAKGQRNDVWACANAECKYYEHRIVRL